MSLCKQRAVPRRHSDQSVRREIPGHKGNGAEARARGCRRIVSCSSAESNSKRTRVTIQGVYNVMATFGVASAAYWWNRVAKATVRDTSLRRGSCWLLMIWLCCSATAEFENLSHCTSESWASRCPGKIAGGEVQQWVGCELLLSETSLGLTASRAQWLEGWYTRLLRDRVVHMQEFQGGLGRTAFVCGALDYDRPFLAPLCAFAVRHAASMESGRTCG